MIKANADILFEASYEVCNKVGGIYTVLSSKAALMKEKYPEYVAVGPYYHDKASTSLEQQPAPKEYQDIFLELRQEGIECIYGRWMVTGEPNTILIDFRNCIKNGNDIKRELWEKFGVETLFSAWDYTEPMVWAWCVGKLLDKIGKKFESKKIVAHFHEWLAGIALLNLKANRSMIKTVFTTHATMLGRAIAGSGDDLYYLLDKINPYEEAKKRGILDKFSTEKACALNCDIFTTVSEITAIEAEKILGRRAEVIVLNGLDAEKFPTIEGTSIKHQETREEIRDFLSYYFFPYYSLDLEESLNYFLLARYEFRNKGLDIYIKALARMNNKLKSEKSTKTIISFFFVPMETHGINTTILENKNIYHEIKHAVEEQNETVKSRLVRDLASNKKIEIENLLPKNFLLSIKSTTQSFARQNSTPPLSTHNLHNEQNNEMINLMKNEGLLNREEDRIKVIIYPVYLSESDGILNLKYYDVVSGCHLGIFPSYYEPYGYTPLECAALGVPSVTSDLAGFGRYIETISKQKEGGIFVLKRFQKKEEDVINEFTGILYDFSKLKKPERVNQKVIAKELSLLADWSILINNYIEAHNMALLKV
jgi:glycogen synthase